MGFFDFLFGTQNKKKQPTKQQDDFDWETHCESCGELLEDCECDWKQQSRQDISQDDEMDDLDFDEMNDVWDELDQQDLENEKLEDEENNLDFDNFNSLDDDDDKF